MAENAENKDDALAVVMLRHEFYRDSYRKVVWLLLMSIAALVILVSGLTYVLTHPPAPQYFATTTDGRISPILPLSQPNLSTAALLQWANTAAIASYNYNFVNYRQTLQEASEYFTPDGWTAFMAALKGSNNLDAVLAKKLIVSAVATGAPVILAQGMLNERYAWKVQMPMLVTYQSASEYSQQAITVTMLVVRVSTLSSPRGVGIAQFIVSSGNVQTNNNSPPS